MVEYFMVGAIFLVAVGFFAVKLMRTANGKKSDCCGGEAEEAAWQAGKPRKETVPYSRDACTDCTSCHGCGGH